MSENEDNIKRISEREFADHQVKVIDPYSADGIRGLWYCSNPKHPYHSFNVAALPGAVLIWGDIGTALFEQNLRWARGSYEGSTGYLIEKISYEFKTKVFTENARDIAINELVENREIDQDVQEALRHTETSEEFYGIAYEHDIEEPPSPEDWDPSILWCVYALRWFCKWLDKQDEVAKQKETEAKTA